VEIHSNTGKSKYYEQKEIRMNRAGIGKGHIYDSKFPKGSAPASKRPNPTSFLFYQLTLSDMPYACQRNYCIILIKSTVMHQAPGVDVELWSRSRVTQASVELVKRSRK
jgi:hypothetical protein